MTTLVVISDEDLDIGDEIGNEIGPVLHCPQASSTEVAADLSTKELVEPIILLATTDRVGWLPALARSQRAQGRRISGYLVMNPAEVSISDEWPDAPVITLVSGTAEQSGNLARLRGWRVIPFTQESLGPSLRTTLEHFA